MCAKYRTQSVRVDSQRLTSKQKTDSERNHYASTASAKTFDPKSHETGSAFAAA
jgi:hypothetical protein